MKHSLLIIGLILCALNSCNRITIGPYQNYQITDDEAIPASKVGGAPYRKYR